MISKIKLGKVRRAIYQCALRAEDMKIGHATLNDQWRIAHQLCEAIGE